MIITCKVSPGVCIFGFGNFSLLIIHILRINLTHVFVVFPSSDDPESKEKGNA